MSTRLVAVGRVFSPFPTIHVTYSTGSNAKAISAGLPAWSPQIRPNEEPDHDLVRKQMIESSIAEME